MGQENAHPMFDTQKAAMTIIVAAIKADGSVADREKKRLRLMCKENPIFSSKTTEENDALVVFALDTLDQHGAKGIQKAAESIPKELREPVFTAAVEMVVADGILRDEEQSFLDKLAQTLGLAQEREHKIIEETLRRASKEF